MGALELRISAEQARRLATDGALAIDPDEADTSYGPLTVTIEVASEHAPSCEVCGYAVVADASPGVWVHDPEELGDEAYQLNEQHAARPPENTSHPAEQPPPPNPLAIHYNDEAFRLDEHALEAWLSGGERRMPYVPDRADPESGNAAGQLFEAAIQRKVILTPTGLSAEIYADDDEQGGGFTLAVYPAPNGQPTSRRRGLTRGWHDVSLIAAAEDEDGENPNVIRAALQALVDELNNTLSDQAA
jgi:hypothetical protein